LSHIPPPPRNRIRRQAAQADRSDRSDRSDRGRPGPAWSGLGRPGPSLTSRTKNRWSYKMNSD